jgi:hypothetical protein
LDARHLARLLWKPVTSFDDLGCLETGLQPRRQDSKRRWQQSAVIQPRTLGLIAPRGANSEIATTGISREFVMNSKMGEMYMQGFCE